MKKKKVPAVVFHYPVAKDNEKKEEAIVIEVEKLREMLNNAELDDDTKYVELTLETEESATKLQIELSKLMMMIKHAELQMAIIPIWLKNFIVDVSIEVVKKNFTQVVGRDLEIEKAWFYLSQKTRNNVFLVGKADVGKTAIAREIIRRISSNDCPKEFYDKRVLMLRLNKISDIRNDFLYRKMIEGIINFLVDNKDKIVLYIPRAVFTKTDLGIMMMFYKCISKYNIPVITTERIEEFEEYFLGDTFISKYLNYILVEEPEMKEIEPMIEGHIRSLMRKYAIDISKDMIKFGIYTSVLTDSVSSNPGNVVNVFKRAFLEAKRKNKKLVDKQCFLSCYPSYTKLYNSSPVEQKRIIAYHEGGHYIVSRYCSKVSNLKMAFVSILPMMDFLGVNWPYIEVGQTLNYTKEYYLDRIAISMGGRVAEEMVTNEFSTSAAADLNHASGYAEKAILRYGFSQRPENRNRSYIDDGDNIRTYLFHEEKKKMVDDEIQELINQGFSIAKTIITEKWKLLELIVEKLLEEEILTGEELARIEEEFEANK